MALAPRPSFPGRNDPSEFPPTAVIVGLVVRLREQKISRQRLRLERARFELDQLGIQYEILVVDGGFVAH